jgi:hypothetical protein
VDLTNYFAGVGVTAGFFEAAAAGLVLFEVFLCFWTFPVDVLAGAVFEVEAGAGGLD